MLKRNLHTVDRFIRVLVGTVCIYYGFIDTSYIAQNTVAILIGLVGIVNLFAAVFAFCPLYGLTGISSYNPESTKAHEA